MNTKKSLASLALVALVAFACAPSDLEPTTFPASYRYMGNMGDVSTAPDCAAYATLEVTDGRSDRAKVGERYLEEGGTRYDVGMEGDAAAWLRQAVEKALDLAGIEQDSGSGHAVRVELQSVVTDESVYRQAEYDGRVVVRASVTGGGADWSGTKDGFAENYGKPGNATNYQETVNHALDKALAALVNDSGFRDALCD